MSVRLTAISGPQQGTVYVFGEGESKVFGRSSSADVRIPDPLLSRHHLMVRGSPSGGIILDLDSSNGTFLNGRLVKEAPLDTGDRVKIGDTVFEVAVEQRSGTAPGDKVATVRALVFCSRCHRGVTLAGERQHVAWEPFQCDDCRRGRGALEPGIVTGYRLGEKVGEDPRGPHYRAARLAGPAGPERPVLMRIFAPTEGTVESRALEHFLREATLAGRLCHEAIVETLDAGEKNGIYFIVEEWIEGQDLRSLLRARRAPIPLEEALRIAGRVAAALEHAYEQGIVHRNVRPSAIFVGPGDAVKLGELGLAKAISDATQSGVIRTGEWVGEANYLPPEQLAAASQVDQRADIYALGATLYHMLAGVPPYDAPTAMRVLRRVGEGDLAPLADVAPGLPRAVCALVERAMEREPARRYALPRDLRAAIEACRGRATPADRNTA